MIDRKYIRDPKARALAASVDMTAERRRGVILSALRLMQSGQEDMAVRLRNNLEHSPHTPGFVTDCTKTAEGCEMLAADCVAILAEADKLLITVITRCEHCDRPKETP